MLILVQIVLAVATLLLVVYIIECWYAARQRMLRQQQTRQRRRCEAQTHAPLDRSDARSQQPSGER